MYAWYVRVCVCVSPYLEICLWALGLLQSILNNEAEALLELSYFLLELLMSLIKSILIRVQTIIGEDGKCCVSLIEFTVSKKHDTS